MKRIFRQTTESERQRHAKIIEGAYKDYPPKKVGRKAAPQGIPAAIRAAREARGWTWYALAQHAGIPNQATIRDIEQGKDAKLSNLQAVARALDLELELVPAASGH
jgi:ribosome-binding protein aMBF1 (putative translation factor)